MKFYAFQSKHGVEFSAFPCCRHVGQNFKDFQRLQRSNSKTFKYPNCFQGLSRPGK